MESSVKHFWNEMTERASAVAEGAKDAVNDAGRFVGEKKNSAMLYIDLARLKNDCEEIYSEIGRTFYRMNSGRWPKEGETAEHRIEGLLAEVDVKEMQIRAINTKLFELSGKTNCPACGKSCQADAAFCPACGAKLTRQER